MNQENGILVFGGGGHALVVIDAIERAGKWSVHGIVDPRFDLGERRAGYPIVEFNDATGISRGVVAIGDNRIRRRLVSQILEICPGFEFVPVIHPDAIIAKDVKIGAGAMILAGSIINSGSQVGTHVIVNTGATLDHENNVGDYAFIGPGVTTAGRVYIAEGTLIGLGTQIIENLNIGKDSIIGAGSLVLKDQPDLSVCYGRPCATIRANILE